MKKITIALLVFFLTGCNKMLNLNPLDQLSDATYWKTPNDFMLAANAFYAYERAFTDANNTNNDNTGNPHNDIRSDLSATLNEFSSGANPVYTTDPFYTGDYTKIRNINYFLDKAQSYATPADIAEYVAEAQFFRAYVYFDLLQLYGEVPLVTTPLSTNSPQLMAPRTSRDSVVNQIVADLQAAIPNLPLQSAMPASNQGRISQGAAQAFLGRVTLYEGTWQEFRGNTARAQTLLTLSVAASQAVIGSNQYALFKPTVLGDSALKYLFVLENPDAQGLSNPAGLGKSANTEYILANQYDYAKRQIGTNFSFANNHYEVTRKLANMYLCTDGLPVTSSKVFQGYATENSEFQNRDNRMRYTLMIPGKTYWTQAPKARIDWKGDATDLANAAYPDFNPCSISGYHANKWSSERNILPDAEAYDYPVIRYAEVLLNYAEAKFELNGTISDADLNLSLNLVRLRINTDNGMPPLTNAFVSANGLDMRTEIRRERTIELFNEGFRVDDLKRWKTAETEMPMDLLGIQWTGTAYQTAWPAAGTLPLDANGCIIFQTGRVWQQKNYLLPLPTQELQLNPNLVQNPGW
jgi:hypothetical protein